MPDKKEEVKQLTLGAAERQDLFTVTEYIGDIHHEIDPEFFKIPEERLAAFNATLKKTDKLDATYNDILFLQTLIDASLEYSLRKSTSSKVSVPHARLESLNRKLGQITDELFRGKTSQGGA